MIDIQDAFGGAAAEGGWSSEHEVSVLLDFIQYERVTNDPLIAERFQSYLDDRLATELDGDLVEEYEADNAPDATINPEHGTTDHPFTQAVGVYGDPGPGYCGFVLADGLCGWRHGKTQL